MKQMRQDRAQVTAASDHRLACRRYRCRNNAHSEVRGRQLVQVEGSRSVDEPPQPWIS